MTRMVQTTRRNFLAGGFSALLAAGSAGGCSRRTGLVDRARLGVCSWSYRLPLDGVAAEMRRIGLKRVHLALQPFLQGDARHGAAEGLAARKAVEARFASGEWVLSATMLSFRHEDYSTLETIRKTGGIVPDQHWDEVKGLIKKAARLSAEWKAPALSLHAGFLDEKNPAALKTFTERMKFMVDVCGEAGVPLILESGQETAEDLARFLTAVPGVGVNFDPANMILYGKGDPVAAVKILAPWIRHVHVKDAVQTKVPGTWGTETVWGEGEVNPAAFLAALETAGYTGAFAIEREGRSTRVADIATAAKRLLG